MSRYLLAFVLFGCGPAAAVDLDKDHRVPNQEPGYCCWASLETLGRYHRVRPLYGLVEGRKADPDTLVAGPGGTLTLRPRNLGYDEAVRGKLDSLGVRYRMTGTGSTDRTLLKSADSHGCVVGLRAGARGPGAHGVVLTRYGEAKVRFWDCNQPQDTWEGSREWFDYWWTGLSVVVEKNE